jgi:hypothetical protein
VVLLFKPMAHTVPSIASSMTSGCALSTDITVAEVIATSHMQTTCLLLKGQTRHVRLCDTQLVQARMCSGVRTQIARCELRRPASAAVAVS